MANKVSFQNIPKVLTQGGRENYKIINFSYVYA